MLLALRLQFIADGGEDVTGVQCCPLDYKM